MFGYVTDASFAEDFVFNPNLVKLEPYRSQGGTMIILATPNLLCDGTDINFHVLNDSSTKIKRVCRSTMQAETYQLQLSVEHGDTIRACIADLNGKLDHKAWEATAAQHKHSVWLTDCKSCSSALEKKVQGKTTDKRLGIEVAALRQSLWRVPGQAFGLPFWDETKPGDTTDSCRWIDTSVMLCDAFTKKMKADFMIKAVMSGYWNIAQSQEAKEGKYKKQRQRSSSKREKKSAIVEIKAEISEGKTKRKLK